MKVVAEQHPDSVVCKFPNGKEVEVTMISVHGEDVTVEENIHEAIRVVIHALDHQNF